MHNIVHVHERTQIPVAQMINSIELLVILNKKIKLVREQHYYEEITANTFVCEFTIAINCTTISLLKRAERRVNIKILKCRIATSIKNIKIVLISYSQWDIIEIKK